MRPDAHRRQSAKCIMPGVRSAQSLSLFRGSYSVWMKILPSGYARIELHCVDKAGHVTRSGLCFSATDKKSWFLTGYNRNLKTGIQGIKSVCFLQVKVMYTKNFWNEIETVVYSSKMVWGDAVENVRKGKQNQISIVDVKI